MVTEQVGAIQEVACYYKEKLKIRKAKTQNPNINSNRNDV